MMYDARSLDRAVERCPSVPRSGWDRSSEADREERIQAHIRRIRSNPLWRCDHPSRAASA